MTQYIDKAVVVTEIERRINENKKDIQHAIHKHLEEYFEGYEDALVLFKEKFLDKLKIKEVDLDEEIERFVKSEEFQKATGTIKVTNLLAKHFYELGLKVQKGE